MRATVHVGPKGGTEYRLWSTEDTYRVVGRFKALPFMSPEEQDKAERMEQDRKAASKAKAESDATWRAIASGRTYVR